MVSAPNGKFLEQHLPLGGFGISRYMLDSMLARLAKEKGVTIAAQTKVTDLSFQLSTFNIQHSTFNIQHSTFNIQHSTPRRLLLPVPMARGVILILNGKENLLKKDPESLIITSQ